MMKNKRLSIADLLGRKPINSRLTPTSFGEPRYYSGGHMRRTIVCDCDCGNIHVVDISFFLSGRTLSCGCYNSDKSKNQSFSVEKINSMLPISSRLVVLEYVGDRKYPSGQSHRHYLCKCSCGKNSVVAGCRLISGNTTSCGCKKTDSLPESRYYIRRTWSAMLSRCYQANNPMYKYYGGKGVVVCEEWRNDFFAFYDWSVANGWKRGLQLDKDIKGNGFLYSPDTCFWATPVQNANAKPSSVKFEYNGKKYNTRELCNIFSVTYGALWWRLKKGMPIEEAAAAAKLFNPKKSGIFNQPTENEDE